jgi:hypothetical protein
MARARIRIYVDGRIVDDTDVVLGVGARDLIGVLGARHGAIAQEAEKSGRRWMIEIVWPDGEHLRWGTDPDPMVLPLEVGLADLAARIADLYD